MSSETLSDTELEYMENNSLILGHEPRRAAAEIRRLRAELAALRGPSADTADMDRLIDKAAALIGSEYWAEQQVTELARLRAANERLTSAAQLAIDWIRILRANEVKPTLAMNPKSGVEYAGIDIEDDSTVKQLRAALAAPATQETSDE